MSKSIALRLCLGAGLAFGCSSEKIDAPPFEIGGVVDVVPERPELKFLEPAGLSKIPLRKKVTARISVTLPKGQKLPSYLCIDICKENNMQGTSFVLEPVSVSGDTYILQGKGRVPPKIGVYRLRIRADYVVDMRKSGVEVSEGMSSSERITFTESGPKIEVTR